tara:strand:+ start:1416 stop:1601 length:186 start_codon:yes stop_codon:yes gene_type:complete
MADTLTYKKWAYNGVDSTEVIKRETRNGKADVAFIPLVAGNRDYTEYKAWLDAGNTPAASD